MSSDSKRQKMAVANDAVCVFSHAPCPDGTYAALFAEMAMKPVVGAFKHYTVQPSGPWPAPPELFKGAFEKKDDGARRVFFVDVCPGPEILKMYREFGCIVTVIDHHDTAIAKFTAGEYPPADDGLVYVFDDKRAAASIAFDYFSDIEHNWASAEFTGDIARRADLVGKYDTWVFEDGDDAHCFNIGLRKLFGGRVSIKAKDAPLLIEKSVYELINEGRAHLAFQKKAMGTIARATSHTLLFEGGPDDGFDKVLVVAVLKVGSFNNSDMCEFVSKLIETPSSPTLVASFNLDTGKVICSIRSQTTNVRVIAEKYRGGGHDHAAGFEIDAETYGGLVCDQNCSFYSMIKTQ